MKKTDFGKIKNKGRGCKIESFRVNRSNLLKVHARTDPDLPSLVIYRNKSNVRS